MTEIAQSPVTQAQGLATPDRTTQFLIGGTLVVLGVWVGAL